MPVRRRSRRRKLTPVTVLVVVALVAGIALLARITQSRSASEPASSSACGNWQQKYAKLHREVLAGRRPRRLCIATTRDEQGLYDRLTGYVTVFLLALVTDRAFLLHQPRDVRARWETIYEPRRHVAWQAERYLDYDVERNRSDFCLLDLWDQMLIEFKDPQHTAANTVYPLDTADEAALHPEAKTLAVLQHNGFSARLVKNPHLGPKLRKLGLTPETAFGCVTEFLFPPRSVIFDGVAAERRALLGGSGNSTLRIGIQVRMGDQYLWNNASSPPISYVSANGFWDCARQIEEWASPGYSAVLWYLVSDSLQLREYAKRELGDKLITNVHAEVAHSALAKSTAAVQLAAAEQWLLSRTDFQVVSMASTFGRTAAMQSLRAPGSVFSVMPPYYATRSCGREDHDTLDSLALVGIDRQLWFMGI